MPPFDPAIHHRHSIRLKEYDYTQSGAYFVTINTFQRECSLGEIRDSTAVLTDFGRIVAQCWEAIPGHYPEVELDAFVVMPNHVHGILVIDGQETTTGRATHASPVRTDERTGGPGRRSLGSIVGQFKSASARQINLVRRSSSAPVWHRNYYERVVRDEDELNRFREYIFANPGRWLEQQS